MKVYLVGGAVRNQLLGLPVTEKDWVVVGATPAQMLAQNFKQVGRDFPVFLHPKTKEEYALARMERKSGSGYYGFECDYNPTVSLEDDLSRRDLTINAIAMDDNGQLIDPYLGQKDLKNKILRHVSDAFVEDPVRVLRVARFAARFHHLGFTVANETLALMYQMVQAGELSHLVPERVWQEWQISLQEANPEQFISVLRNCGALKIVIPELDRLFGVPNPQNHHPEIDTGIHSLMVLQAAVAITREPTARFAALVHDLGKGLTPISNWPSHHGHEEGGVPIIDHMCSRLHIPNEYRYLAVLVARFHLQIHKIMELKANTIVSLLEQMDAFRKPESFQNLLTACQADAQGRGFVVAYPQAQKWSYILSECAKITAKEFIAQGYEGKAIKEQMHNSRVDCVKKILKTWKIDEE